MPNIPQEDLIQNKVNQLYLKYPYSERLIFENKLLERTLRDLIVKFMIQILFNGVQRLRCFITLHIRRSLVTEPVLIY